MNVPLRLLLVTSIAAIFAACGQGTDQLEPSSSSPIIDEYGAELVSGDNAQLHLMDGAQRAAGTAPHLTYFGGPVLQNVKVVTLFWRNTVNNQTQLSSFYSTITHSAYFSWLTEYNTASPHQTIGFGSLFRSVVDPASPSSANISDAQIQAEISRLIGAGTLPAPDANTLYMTHFPAGISITQGGSRSCVQFCAYHGTFKRNNVNVYYGVIPDMSGGCARGCGNSTYFNNTTSVSSHELIESVTDAAVGLATTFGPPLAWYDRTNGEIGDICNGQQAQVAGFTVQLEWSNSQNRCRAQ